MRSGTHSSRRHNQYPLSLSAASLLLPPSPRPRRTPAAGPEVGREEILGAALTWLEASSAGGQQGAAQTQSRGDEQQLPRPHCPEARRAPRGAAPGDGLRLREARVPYSLPPPARSSRPEERKGLRTLAARGQKEEARRCPPVAQRVWWHYEGAGRGGAERAGAEQRRQGRAPPGAECAPRRGRRTPLPAGPSAAA